MTEMYLPQKNNANHSKCQPIVAPAIPPMFISFPATDLDVWVTSLQNELRFVVG